MTGAGVATSILAVMALLLGAGSVALAQATGDTASAGQAAAVSTTGEQTYREICQACHMANAEGGQGAGVVPALAANAHLADRQFVLDRVTHGKGGMPAFAEMLSAEQTAGVIGYVRTHFGNSYTDAVTPADVKRVTAAMGGD
ncbi:cytochrome c [Novosphingobium flavum]|uniref:Cytochrome c n=1 Tax=Novosphingobium flavum TaxID=1778672 RepID=A0A7X1KM63_9SPHN|nr:cytochrome c [Novosphingobium flavum]MBC2666311.1 cytochrome c [Novosphingobium flavum]